MDSISVELNGSEIASIQLDGNRLTIAFSRAYLVKTMTGSAEKTRWWQAGSLVIDGADVTAPLPQGPQVCAGGDLDENIYTYRDMIPIPFESRGRVGCRLKLQGQAESFEATGTAIRLQMHDAPKYIEHLRPAKASG